MLDSNTLAEIDNDQSLRFKSAEDAAEHYAAIDADKAKRKDFVSKLRLNHDVKIADNVYTLRDALELIPHDRQFWNHEIFISQTTLPCTIGFLFEHSDNENIIQDMYVQGALPEWNYVIECAIDKLADHVFGVDYE